VSDLGAAVEPTARGDPRTSLRWTCKSTRTLARELRGLGHRVSDSAVRALLHEQGYSLQANRKTREGRQHPDRNAQFEYIDRSVSRQIRRGGPAISVDTKKKELVGEFKNGGRAWRPRGDPVEVRVHDFLDPALGKAIPYGLYDFARNRGWVAVGVDHDTAQFAVGTIRRWWGRLGRPMYPKARSLVIVADGGGSNGARWTSTRRNVPTTRSDESQMSLIVSVQLLQQSEDRHVGLMAYLPRRARGSPTE